MLFCGVGEAAAVILDPFWVCGEGRPVAMVHGPGWDVSVVWFGIAFYCSISHPLSLLSNAGWMESSSLIAPPAPAGDPSPKTTTIRWDTVGIVAADQQKMYEERKKAKLEEKIKQFKLQERRQIELRVDQAIRDSGEEFDNQMRSVLINDQMHNLSTNVMRRAAASGKTFLEELHGE